MKLDVIEANRAYRNIRVNAALTRQQNSCSATSFHETLSFIIRVKLSFQMKREITKSTQWVLKCCGFPIKERKESFPFSMKNLVMPQKHMAMQFIFTVGVMMAPRGCGFGHVWVTPWLEKWLSQPFFSNIENIHLRPLMWYYCIFSNKHPIYSFRRYWDGVEGCI